MQLKLKSKFLDFRDKIKTKIRVKKENFVIIICIILIVFIAFFIRISPLFVGPPMIKAFDPWIQYYSAEYLSQNGIYEYFHWHDFKSWYPEGIDRFRLRPGLQFTVSIIYWVLNGLGIPIQLYDVCYYFPAFAGALTVFIMYFLGKEILDKRTGLLAAFFLAFNPGHMQRTVAGFFDNETIGILGTLLTLLFFIKALKTGKIHYAILAGLSLGFLSLSWGGYVYTLLIIPLLTGILILVDKYSPRLFIAYAGTEGVGILVYSLFIKFSPEGFFNDFEFLAVFLFSVVLIIYHIFYRQKTLNPKFYDAVLTFLRWAIIPIILIGAIVLWVFPNIIPFGFDARFTSVFSPMLRQDLQLVASVAEHMPSPWSVFYYNTLIPSLLVPVGIYFGVKRGNEEDFLIIIYVLTLFYFTGSMIRIILLFAPAVCLIGSYGLSNILKLFGSFIGKEKSMITRRRKRQVKTTIGSWESFGVYAIVGFLMFAQVSHAADISRTSLSGSQIIPGGILHDWEESMTWIRTNLPPGTVVVSWWDYGYWITPIGNATTINDNATINQTRIGATGMAFMQTDELESAKILRHLKADYILVYFTMFTELGGDEGKWPWMLRICNDNYKAYKNFGWEAYNWKENSVFDESEYQNPSTGVYKEKWFQSQLFRLMAYGLPTRVEEATKDFEYFYAQKVAGDPSRNIEPSKLDDGRLWSEVIPYHGYYDFKVFKPTFFSTQGLVKLFRVDYTALDSSVEVSDPKVYDNGFANFKLINTGIKEVTLDNVFIKEDSYAFTIEDNDNQIEPAEEKLVWIDAQNAGFELNDVVNISVSIEAEALEDTKYTFEASSTNVLIEPSPEYEIKINRENSIALINEDNLNTSFYLEVENTGEGIINLNATSINGIEFNQTISNSLLKPGSKTTVYLPESPINKSALGDAMDKLSDTIRVIASEGIYDETIFTYNKKDYKISIIPEDRVLSDEAKIFYSKNRTQIPIDLNSACAYDNGSIFIEVKNTGNKLIGLDSVYIDGVSKDFISVDDDYLLSKDEIKDLIIDYPDIENNEEIELIVAASGLDGYIAATDVGYLYPIKNSANFRFISESELNITHVWANETIEVALKNTGNILIELDDVIINGTESISIDDVVFNYNDKTLDLQEIAIFSFNSTQYKINQSNIIEINVSTKSGMSIKQSFTAEVNPVSNPDKYSIEILDISSAEYSQDLLTLNLKNIGDDNLTIDAVYVNNTYIPWSTITIVDNENLTIETGEEITLTITLTDLELLIGTINVDDTLEILIRTQEGAEDTHVITVVE